MTRGDLYITDVKFNQRAYSQHFMLKHDAFPSSFVRFFKEAYKEYEEGGIAFENCLTVLHPRLLEANNDRYGGFYAKLDFHLDVMELGWRDYRESKIFFKGSLAQLLILTDEEVEMMQNHYNSNGERVSTHLINIK